MKSSLRLLPFALCAFLFACSTPTATTQPDPDQVARITAVATTLAQAGTAITLEQHPEHRATLLAVAEAIEQAAALREAPPPSNLVNLVSSAAMKAGGSAALAGIGLQAAFGIYQQLYAANTASALDKQPAFRAVLQSLAAGIRSAVALQGQVPPPASAPQLDPLDFELRPARR